LRHMIEAEITERGRVRKGDFQPRGMNGF
jgi:hypothetical protein